MCGIAGVLLNDGNTATEELVKKMGKVLCHRGPDNFATCVNGNFGTVHNRLSILDLSAQGNQPFYNERYILSYNGEIYNYLELKRQLLSLGISFQSTSDTEVLFHYLINFGVHKTLQAIKGMFAFGFYDLQEKKLYLCRDRYGIKPLVWKFHENSLYWASEVKALKEVTCISLDSVKSLFSVASIGDHSNEYTPFDDVYQVKPGNYLICTSQQQPKSVEYYNVAQDVDQSYYQELDRMPEPDLIKTFERLLSRSVESMLMSDAPMGVFVSGGVDSSLVASLAAKFNPKLVLFTANVIGKYSEFEDAQRLSEHIHLPLYDARFEPEMMLSQWAKVTYHYECPIVTHTNAAPFAAVASVANEQRVKAVLTGEGSDELFLGYPRLATQRYKKIVAAPVKFLQSLYRIVPGLHQYLFSGKDDSIYSMLDLLVQGFERQRIREENLKVYNFLPHNQIEHQYLTIQMMREHLLSLLHRNDRMGMLASIESRFPFLDEEIVRFGVNLPLKWKLSHSLRFHDYKHPFIIDKAIVRKTAAKMLPFSAAYKKKAGLPMYGHRHVVVRPGYFAKGFVAELMDLSQEAEEYMIRTQNPYFIAKLVSLDVFGRIFALNEKPECITGRILDYIKIA